jgi:hypothetical protein
MKLTGKRLQYAYLLVAEGKMTDEAIAKHLKVSVATLAARKRTPYFIGRVQEFRSLLEMSGPSQNGVDVPSGPAE